MKIRAIQKYVVGEKTYMPGEFIDGLKDKDIKQGLVDGLLAEVKKPVKKKVKTKEVVDAENS